MNRDETFRIVLGWNLSLWVLTAYCIVTGVPLPWWFIILLIVS